MVGMGYFQQTQIELTKHHHRSQYISEEATGRCIQVEKWTSLFTNAVAL